MIEAARRNVDSRELAYYEQLAGTWWAEQGPFWPLHRLYILRTRYLRDVLCELYDRDPGTRMPLQGLRLLDVGCGGGILSEAMARLGADVHGIDVVERNLEVARLHARRCGLAVNYQLATAEELADHGRHYDIVLNMEVVEHVPAADRLMKACARLVLPSGTLVVATINRNLKSFLFAIVGAEYVLGWLPKGTHSWRRFRKPEELERVLTQNGLQVLRRCGVRANVLTRQFALTPNLSVNYMLVARKTGGRMAATTRAAIA